MPTLYEILEVSPNASPEVIKMAYKALCKKYHPDVYKGVDAEERMKLINRAYEILSDDIKRKQYDSLGINSKDSDDSESGNETFSEDVRREPNSSAKKRIKKRTRLVPIILIILAIILGAGYYAYQSGMFVDRSWEAQCERVLSSCPKGEFAYADINDDGTDELLVYPEHGAASYSLYVPGERDAFLVGNVDIGFLYFNPIEKALYSKTIINKHPSANQYDETEGYLFSLSEFSPKDVVFYRITCDSNDIYYTEVARSTANTWNEFTEIVRGYGNSEAAQFYREHLDGHMLFLEDIE